MSSYSGLKPNTKNLLNTDSHEYYLCSSDQYLVTPLISKSYFETDFQLQVNGVGNGAGNGVDNDDNDGNEGNTIIIDMLPENIEKILSNDGKNFFDYVKALVEIEKKSLKRNVFSNHRFERSLSGSWFENENSKWYKKYEGHDKNVKGCINTRNDIVIVGRLHGNKTNEDSLFRSTSPCIFICKTKNEKEGWCYTKSGSIYFFT